MENASKASTQFGLDLFRLVCAKSPDKNGFISPFSLSTALAMTQLGAAGETSKGMIEGLRWPEGKETVIHEENQSYISMLQKPQEQYDLSVANRLFVNKGYTLLPEYLQQTQKLYLAQAVSSDFSTNSEQERVNINTWVADQTRDRIKDLIPSGVLDSDTRMVLVNAIYFKGIWTSPFDAKATRPMPFKMLPNSTKNVLTMQDEKSLRFWLDKDGTEGFSALELPYKGDGLSMVILLPNEDFGLANMEKSLTQEKLTSVFSRLGRREKIKVRLPKFEMTCSSVMKESLSQMGMAAAFNPLHADFSKMTSNKDLFMSEVLHKAFVKVDEKGSEAAAATAVVMRVNCIRIPEEVPEFFMTCSYQVKDPLCQMGMSSAFSPLANFSKMSPTNDLAVSEVVHKAFVKVDEEGSEAAAATAVMMTRMCVIIPEEVLTFYVDRPFLFMIVDKTASNSSLFMGRVTDPASC